MKRRTFLKSTAALAPMILSPRALGREGPGPNDQVNVGVIGLGRRAWAVTGSSLEVPGMNIVAICDCFKPRIDEFRSAFEEHEENWTSYIDFREMLDKEDLDAALCITTTPASGWVTTHAMSAGLDVYIEKPMCISVEEGRHMVTTARRHGAVTQVGTQGRSFPIHKWACDLIQEGAIGKVKKVEAADYMGPREWQPHPAEPKPEGGTVGWWDVWTNQAPLRPYNSTLHEGAYKEYRDYEHCDLSYGLTGHGTHSYDTVQWALGANLTTPVEMTLEEPYEERRLTRFDSREEAEREDRVRFADCQDKDRTGLRGRVTMRYRDETLDDVELDLHLDMDYGPWLGGRFIGEDGTIDIHWGTGIEAEPKEIMERDDRPPEGQDLRPHLENWIECIKSREACNADIEYAQRSHTICFLVNVIRELGEVGETLHWDPVQERFTDSEEGNEHISIKRERRPGYELAT